MADPSIITVAISVPGLPAILQAIQDLRTEYQITNGHLQNIDARLRNIESRSADESQFPEDIVETDLTTDHAPEVPSAQEELINNIPGALFKHETLINGTLRVSMAQDLPVDNTPPVIRDASSRDSSPSADEGLTNTRTNGEEAAVLGRSMQSAMPAAGQKRERVEGDMGFAMRDSAAQIAQRRVEDGHEEGPSLSESPFDYRVTDRPDNHGLTSDAMDFIPPVRPRTSMQSPAIRTEIPQASRSTSATPALQDSIDASYISAHTENVTYSRTGRLRRPAQRLAGFVSTPTEAEITRMSDRVIGRRR
ncbi:hypothetical protein E4T42_08506 [Aureobasidium subglaciale]|nr:hypothetical protein E4T42_08506 [Aureobasidium subglaciale]